MVVPFIWRKTKEELIREAYGPDYDSLKDRINMSDGYCTGVPTPEYHMRRGVTTNLSMHGYSWIPRGLREDIKNNGWQDIKTTELISGKYYEFYSSTGEQARLKVRPWGIKHLKHVFILVKEITLPNAPVYVL